MEQGFSLVEVIFAARQIPGASSLNISNGRPPCAIIAHKGPSRDKASSHCRETLSRYDLISTAVGPKGELVFAAGSSAAYHPCIFHHPKVP
jgi:hypothetical protein